MHRYRIPATIAVAAVVLIALVGASRHTSAGADTARATGIDALARPTGAPYLRPTGADVRLAKLVAAIHQRDVENFLRAAKANADAQAQAAAQQRQRTTRTATPQQAGSSTGHACGGDLPPCCVMMRESKGNPNVVNASSGAAGKWQFMPGTWAGYGGYSSAAQAPESVQDARARQIYAGGAGAGNWAGSGC